MSALAVFSRARLESAPDEERRALCGWDYMHTDSPGKLQIPFEYGGPFRTWWRDEEWRIGVYRADEEG